MNLLLKHCKKIILTSLVFALLFIANISLISAFKDINRGVVAAEFSNSDSITISNGSFTSTDSSNGYPYKANNLTYSENISTSHVTHGVINLNENTYSNNYKSYDLGKDDNPEKFDDSIDSYCLMINSLKGKNSCGYTTSSFNLDKNGHFFICAYVNTSNVDGASSLYLFNNGEVFAEIDNINTKNSWQPYYFFVSTSDYKDLTLSLGLWQGSRQTPAQAVVFFDQLSAGEIAKSDISTMINDNVVDGKTVFTKPNANYYYKDLSGENILKEYPISSNPFTIADEGNANVADGNFTSYGYMNHNGEEVFKIENKQANSSCFETESYTLLPNKVYKFSVRVKATLKSGSAYIKAVESLDEDSEETPKASDALTISSTSNKFDNGFVEYAIIINSDSQKTRDIKLQIGLGQSGSEAVGTAYFKDYKISSVPYSEFSSNNYAKTFDLSSDYNKSQTISNFAFDLTKATDISLENEIKINDANDWTVQKSNSGHNQVAGVYNVAYFDKLNKQGLTNIANPGFISEINNESNNVLMLHNEVSDYLTVKSNEFSLSKGKAYKLTVYVQTQVSGASQSGANIKIETKEDSILLASIDNIKTYSTWKEYSIYIKAGYEDLSAILKLSLGEKNNTSNGYAYFDICRVDEIDDSVFTAFEKTSENAKIDLTKPISYAGSDNNPFLFELGTSLETNGVSAGAFDLEGDLSKILVADDFVTAKSNKSTDKYVLAINNHDDGYSYYDGKLDYSLASGKFYKISVDIYTAYLRTQTKDAKLGASLQLTNFENGIKSEIISNYEWTTYTIYICPDQDVTTQIRLALGSKDNLVSGVALFNNLLFEEIADEATYTSLTSEIDDSMLIVGEVIKEEEETEKEDKKSDINWVLLTSTLTAVAVIIAVLGVGFKKVFKPHKKRIKKSKVEYDRNNSVIRQKYRRLAYLKREQEIRNLEKKLVLLNEDKLDKETKYKQLLSKMREVKLANRNGKYDAELVSINKDLNRASKNVAKIGVVVNKVNSEIAFKKTEGYLQDLTKRLEKQDEIAKSKGSSIEEILKNENIEVTIEKDDSVDNALSKADFVIEDNQNRIEQERLEAERKEQERIEREKAEAERKEQERLEKERLEQERLEQERLERERHEAERLEQERLEKEKAEQVQQQEKIETVEDKTVSSETIENSSSEVETKQEVEQQETETQPSNEQVQPSTDSQVSGTEVQPTAEQIETNNSDEEKKN